MYTRHAFTLIELLIVVAIIAILAAIAVPNFLEAQMRSKVSRAKADMRSLATAVEAYSVDHNTYPTYSNPEEELIGGLTSLTSPLAYISAIPRDALGPSYYPSASNPRSKFRPSFYELGSGKANVRSAGQGGQWYPNDTWMLESDGPNKRDDTSAWLGPNLNTSAFPWVALTGTDFEMELVSALKYDPTNGTISGGEVYRTGGVRPDSPPLRMLFERSD